LDSYRWHRHIYPVAAVRVNATRCVHMATSLSFCKVKRCNLCTDGTEFGLLLLQVSGYRIRFQKPSHVQSCGFGRFGNRYLPTRQLLPQLLWFPTWQDDSNHLFQFCQPGECANCKSSPPNKGAHGSFQDSYPLISH
jgi:hypothetical protein